MTAETPDLKREEQPQVPTQNPEEMRLAGINKVKWETQEKTEKLNKEIMVYDNAFKEVDSDLIKWAKNIISQTIDEQFKDLSPEQKEKIKLWILWKILNSWVADVMIGWLNKKMEGYKNTLSTDLSNKNFDSILKLFDDDKESAKVNEWPMDKFLKIFQGEVVELKAFVTKNKWPALDNFLKSPKSISEFSNKTDLSNYTETSPEDERKFFQSVKNKLDGYDIKLIHAEKLKEYTFDLVTKTPNMVSDWIAKFVAFLCTLPFLKDFLKPFLWLKWENEKEMEIELKEQIILRKSVNNLKTYGITYNEKFEIIESKNDPAISALKDKDLSKMSYKKMENFFGFCKKNNIDINAKDFWFNVFEKKIIKTETKDEAWNKSENKIELNLNIDEKWDFYESTKWPNDAFYSKLNGSIIPQTPQKAQETPKKPAPAPKIAKTWVTAASLKKSHWNNQPETKPEQAEKQDLPKSVEFIKNESIAVIDGKRYKVAVHKGIVPVNVEDFSYKEWILNIEWSLLQKKWNEIFDKDIVKLAYAKLKSDKRFEQENDKWYKLTLEQA